MDCVGKRLKQARKEKGITLVNAGMLLNITHATLSRYENNHLEPNLETLKKLCILYDVSSDYILELPEDRKHI